MSTVHTKNSVERALPTLVLHAAGPKLDVPEGCVLMAWGDAQWRGQTAFHAFKQFICLPPRYPREFEHNREAMFERLRSSIIAGARVLFVVPTSKQRPSNLDSHWNRTRFLVCGVTGVEISRVARHGASGSAPTVDCPPRIRGHLARHPGDMILVRTPEVPPRIACGDECVALAETVALAHEPSAAVGFLGSGVWAILPWGGKSSSGGELAELLALLEELESMAGTRGGKPGVPGTNVETTGAGGSVGATPSAAAVSRIRYTLDFCATGTGYGINGEALTLDKGKRKSGKVGPGTKHSALLFELARKTRPPLGPLARQLKCAIRAATMGGLSIKTVAGKWIELTQDLEIPYTVDQVEREARVRKRERAPSSDPT